MTALYTFDVYATLDGFGSYGEGGDWGGYWGKEGPQFLAQRLHLYQQPHRIVLGPNTFREMASMIGPKEGAFRELDPVNTAFRNLPLTVISNSITGDLDWPDATQIKDDAIHAVRELKSQSSVPLLVPWESFVEPRAVGCGSRRRDTGHDLSCDQRKNGHFSDFEGSPGLRS